jgi:hypothetical protein
MAYNNLPGACTHMTEANIVTPTWGWIRRPDPGLWDRIGPSNPVHATEGNLRRMAISRCTDYLSTLGRR